MQGPTPRQEQTTGETAATPPLTWESELDRVHASARSGDLNSALESALLLSKIAPFSDVASPVSALLALDILRMQHLLGEPGCHDKALTVLTHFRGADAELRRAEEQSPCGDPVDVLRVTARILAFAAECSNLLTVKGDPDSVRVTGSLASNARSYLTALTSTIDRLPEGDTDVERRLLLAAAGTLSVNTGRVEAGVASLAKAFELLRIAEISTYRDTVDAVRLGTALIDAALATGHEDICGIVIPELFPHVMSLAPHHPDRLGFEIAVAGVHLKFGCIAESLLAAERLAPIVRKELPSGGEVRAKFEGLNVEVHAAVFANDAAVTPAPPRAFERRYNRNLEPHLDAAAAILPANRAFRTLSHLELFTSIVEARAQAAKTIGRPDGETSRDAHWVEKVVRDCFGGRHPLASRAIEADLAASCLDLATDGDARDRFALSIETLTDTIGSTHPRVRYYSAVLLKLYRFAGDSVRAQQWETRFMQSMKDNEQRPPIFAATASDKASNGD